MLDVYILKTPVNAALVDRVRSKGAYKVYDAPSLEITPEILHTIAKSTSTKYFYILKLTSDIEPKIDISFTPPEWDKNYLHIWGKDDSKRLYNTENVLKKPHKFSDAFIAAGYCELKHVYDIPITAIDYPIIFLSYDELFADENFEKLKAKHPSALRVHGIKGIFEAHKEAANLAYAHGCEMFYVVDADAIVEPTFSFSYVPSMYDINSVHIWHSKNPVNGLEYGYGGVKLFPTTAVLKAKVWGIDFTTSVSNSVKVMPTVSNVTAFNTDPYSSWKAGFREVVKLVSADIKPENAETQARIEAWCNIGYDAPNGEFTIMGACEGRDYALANVGDKNAIACINDFTWLEERFSN